MSTTPPDDDLRSSAGRWRTPNNAVLHYATELTLRPDAANHLDRVVSELQGVLRAWCSRKLQDISASRWLSSDAFTRSGQWRKTVDPAVGLRTELAGKVEEPDAWGLFMQERQMSGSFRRLWHTDVTIRSDGAGAFRMFVSVSYSLDHGYLGWEPPLPEPTAPRFVRDILEAKSFSVRTGDLRVGKQVLSVTPKESKLLSRVVFDPGRTLPVILITGEPNPVTYPVVPEHLHRALLGTCYVVWAKVASGWGDAWRAALPEGYLPPINSVRIYQPGAEPSRHGDAARHRYFRDDEIHKHGGEEFTRMLQHGLVRRFSAPSVNRLRGVDDIVALRAEADFNLHRSKLKGAKEEADFYLEEHGKLASRLRDCEQLLQDADQEREIAVRERDSATAVADHLRKEIEYAKQGSASQALSDQQRELLTRLCRGEATPEDCLAALELLFPSAVTILPSARKSAAEAGGFRESGALKDQLFKLASVYRDALARGEGDQVAKSIFGHSEYSSKESGLTNAGKRSRTFIYEGESIFMERHLKIGVKFSDAATLRTHFHWDHKGKRVVIGHCGKHLPL
jgi:hypothetical protein